MKRIIKHYLKNSPLVFNIISSLIYLYLKFAYFTSKWHILMPLGQDAKMLNDENGLLFAIWHDRLAYSMHIFSNYKNMYGLASPHSDGKIISKIVLMMKYKIIEGSTNKNSSAAVKEIIERLKTGSKIVVTPDGPRGPVHKNGSVITKIASKYNKKVVPMSCYASKYFKLNSWDEMMIPRPFSKIIVMIGEPLDLTGAQESDRLLLETKLNDLTKECKWLSTL